MRRFLLGIAILAALLPVTAVAQSAIVGGGSIVGVGGGSGQGSAVVSVNGQTGPVSLASTDLTDSSNLPRLSVTSKQTFSGPIQLPSTISVLQGSETVSFSATPTLSTTTRASYIVLTGNVTSFTLAAGADGQEKTLTFCQNGTGGFTVAAPTNVRGFMGITTSPATTANKCNSQHFTYSAAQVAWLADSPGVLGQ